MDGSTLLFILLPIVSISLLAGWIGMLFYVDAHPGHKTPSAAGEPAVLIPLPVPAYSRQSPDIAGPSLPGDAQRPAA